MNITRFIKFLNEKKGYGIQGSYYSYIDEWKHWWSGHVPSFHDRLELGLDNESHKRTLFSLRMPKRVCEDWASLLLNDKTTLTLKDDRASKWLLGAESQQTGGVLRDISFWDHANGLVELAFRSGTGAFVMSVENITLQNHVAVISPNAEICMDYLPAECILPITVKHGKIVDVAFATEVTAKGKVCIYLQTHELVTENGIRQYKIKNSYFRCDNEDSDAASFTEVALPDGVLGELTTGTDIPWFSVFSPSIVKNIPEGPGLGMAVFAEALDPAKQCDVAFDNYHNDIYLGGKKVFYNKQLVKSVIGDDGKEHFIAPDDLRQRLFIQPDDIAGSDPDEPKMVHEYNPDLRVEANSRAVQDALDYLSFKCGLGTHHYQFNAGNIATATQYTGDRQDMVQHANRHQTRIETALIGIVRAMLYAGKSIIGVDLDVDTPVTVNFDDSYISDSETRRKQDQDDALNGFIPKWMYNMEWRGMSESDAKEAASEASSGSTENDEFGFGGI